jgi:hypothetical protein
MEKWLLGGTKPPTMYVSHAMDMLLQKWSFPLEGHQISWWFVETSYEEDEEGTVQPVVGTLTPITFQVAQLHLERVVELECSLQEQKAKNEHLNCLLGWVGETIIRLKLKR